MNICIENLKNIIDLEGMVEETIEYGSGLLIVNNEFQNADDFFDYIKEYEDKISYSEYITNDKLFMIVNGNEYEIEIA